MHWNWVSFTNTKLSLLSYQDGIRDQSIGSNHWVITQQVDTVWRVQEYENLQGEVTLIYAAAMALTWLLTLYTKEGVESNAFFRILSGQGKNMCVLKWLMNEVQHSEMIKSFFALWSSGQGAKWWSKFWLTAKAVTTAYMGVTTPWPGAGGWEQISRSLLSEVTHETLGTQRSQLVQVRA